MSSAYETLLKQKPPRVLVVSHMYPRADSQIGGIFVHEQVKALQALGVEVLVASGEPFVNRPDRPLRGAERIGAYLNSDPDIVEYDGVPVVYFPWFVADWIPEWAHARAYAHGLSLIKTRLQHLRSFDIVHAHTSLLDGAAGHLFARYAKTPFFITEHTGPFDILTRHPAKRRKTLASVRAADCVFAVSSALRREMIRQLGVSDERVQVLGNGVDTDLFHPPSPGPQHRMTRALWIGHHVEVKRVDRLLSAFAAARAVVPDLRLTLIGDGHLKDAAIARATGLGLGESVAFQGAQKRGEVAAQIRDCDYVVVASEVETFGLVALEAMASGKPVLSTACGGPQDLILDDSSGLIVENSDDGLRQGLIDMSRRTFDARHIRAQVESTRSWSKVADTLLRAYSGALQGRSES